MRISDWSSDVCSSDLNDIDANRDLVLRLMDALNECDVAIIREIIHPDAEWWVLGFGSFDRETLIAQLSDMLGAAKVKETKRSEEHTSELQSLMRISYAVFCLNKKRQAIMTLRVTT